ncbi:MAG: hypothetical protein ABI877_12085 [Gemmatimonadaceae bacterium]
MTFRHASSWSSDVGRKDSEMRLIEIGALRRVFQRLTSALWSPRRRVRPVRYGGREFSEPQLLAEATLPREPGIYAIQIKNWWGTMQPLHFGNSANMHEDLTVEGHPAFMHWLTHRGAHRGLFVSILVDKDSDPHLRHMEGLRLNRHHFPHRTHSVDEYLTHHRIQRTPRRHR